MKTRLSDAAFDRIRDLILSGELQPGAPLSELRLGEDLGMSRSPIRTALERMTAAGLVSSVPGKGYFVSTLSVARVTCIMEIREALESFAAARGDFDPRRSVLVGLREVFDFYANLPGLPTEREWAILTEADRRFHAEIISSLNNPVASDTVAQLSLSIEQVRSLGWGRAGRFRVGAREHVEIIDAIVGEDPELAGRLVATHISGAKEFLVQLISSRAQANTDARSPFDSDRLDSWLRTRATDDAPLDLLFTPTV